MNRFSIFCLGCLHSLVISLHSYSVACSCSAASASVPLMSAILPLRGQVPQGSLELPSDLSRLAATSSQLEVLLLSRLLGQRTARGCCAHTEGCSCFQVAAPFLSLTARASRRCMQSPEGDLAALARVHPKLFLCCNFNPALFAALLLYMFATDCQSSLQKICLICSKCKCSHDCIRHIFTRS